jgi:hypothetical protein
MSTGTKPNAGTTPDPERSTSGFHAQLEGASLWDLVQMECLARSHLAVEVKGEGGAGYLFFDGGRVVHASTLRNRGLPAALEILGWTQGSFQPSHRSWPAASSIEMSHEALLLHAAKLRDEQGASNLVAFPSRGADADAALDDVELLEVDQEEVTGVAAAPATGQEEGNMSVRNPNADDTPASPLGQRVESAADFPIMVRLSSHGAVVRNKGGSEELAEATAYAHRLVQLTGELLGLEEFVALECGFSGDRMIVFTENDGDVVALRPRPELNLQALRERLGL